MAKKIVKSIPFKKGDWVTLVKKRNGWNSAGLMDHYDGRTVQLTDVRSDGTIFFKEDGDWLFTITDAGPATANEIELAKLQPFRVGDWVTLQKISTWVEDMERDFDGKTVKITSIHPDWNTIKFDGSRSWAFNTESCRMATRREIFDTINQKLPISKNKAVSETPHVPAQPNTNDQFLKPGDVIVVGNHVVVVTTKTRLRPGIRMATPSEIAAFVKQYPEIDKAFSITKRLLLPIAMPGEAMPADVCGEQHTDVILLPVRRKNRVPIKLIETSLIK